MRNRAALVTAGLALAFLWSGASSAAADKDTLTVEGENASVVASPCGSDVAHPGGVIQVGNPDALTCEGAGDSQG